VKVTSEPDAYEPPRAERAREPRTKGVVPGGIRVVDEGDDQVRIAAPVSPKVRVPTMRCTRCKGTGIKFPSHYGRKGQHKPNCPGCMACNYCGGEGVQPVGAEPVEPATA
jgi:hypothetical protein